MHGNGHGMMMERNNREALQVILDWVERRELGREALRGMLARLVPLLGAVQQHEGGVVVERPDEEPERFGPASGAPGEQLSVVVDDPPWHEHREGGREVPALGIARRPDCPSEVRLAQQESPQRQVGPVHPADRVNGAARGLLDGRRSPNQTVGRQSHDGIRRSSAGRCS